MDRHGTGSKRLLWQIYPSYLIITIMALAAASWYATFSLKDFFMDQVATDLEARAVFFNEMFSEEFSVPQSETIDTLCKRIGRNTATRITVILSSGVVVGDSDEDPAKMENHGGRPEVFTALTGKVGKAIRFSTTLQRRMMYVALPVRRDNTTTAVVRCAMALTAMDQTFQSVRYKIIWGGVVIALLAAGISLLVSGRISKPLEKMKRGADRFAGGELSHRLAIPGTEEMAGLARALNEMAGRLDDKIRAVIRHRNELEAVLGSMKEGVLALDMEERILSINQSAAAMFNKDPWEMQNRSLQESIRNPELQKFVTKALHEEENLEIDITFYQTRERILSVHSTSLLDAKEERIGILLVLNDVTRLRKLENMRKDFVANVSHEIKTPLTAIQGFVETLIEDKDNVNEDGRRFLWIIDRHVHRLVAIIEDLLNLSRIERDKEKGELPKESASIADMIHTAVQVVQSKAVEKNIYIRIQCDPDLKMYMDPPLMEQAVVNLLDNAIKYSEAGSTVNVSGEKNINESVIKVQDSGIGISPEHLPRLFERFYRVDKARSRKLGGTGLGLAIVKHIVQAHGGNVSVESTSGKGTVFTLKFPG